MDTSIQRRAAAEFVGTALLLAAVVGSGIMGERLSSGNTALALLANSLATGAALVALILAFGPISGAHFNPIVSAVASWRRSLQPFDAGVYVAAQCGGALLGVAVANVMFDEPVFTLSTRMRSGLSQGLSEAVATFGLLAVVLGSARQLTVTIPFAVGGYITAAYWFTSSTSFANPAVTVARAFTESFAGIRLADVPLFLMGQAIGAVAAAVLFEWFSPHPGALGHVAAPTPTASGDTRHG